MTAVSDMHTDLSIDEINLGDPDFWLRPDVDAALALLRNVRPISWHEHPEAGRGFWSIVRYHDVDAVSRNAHIFRNREGNRIYHDPEAGLVRPASNSMSELDAPEHKRSRRIISQAFTPKQIQSLYSKVEAIADRIVDGLHGEDEVDFVDRVSSVLPVEVICDVLGIPYNDRPFIYELGGKAFGDQDPEVGGTPAEGARAAIELKAYGKQLAAERRKNPVDDVFSRTVNAVVDGDRLTDEELGTYFSLLVTAGNETTGTGMNQGMLAFTLFPNQLAHYLEDVAGHEVTMVEEILRWGTPTKHVRRVVHEDHVFNGILFRKGDKVATWFISANRDENVFEDPYMFDVTRKVNPHVSFGTGGPHFCLGANLARMELAITFRKLFTAFPKIESAGEAKRLRSTLFNGVKSLPIRLNA